MWTRFEQAEPPPEKPSEVMVPDCEMEKLEVGQIIVLKRYRYRSSKSKEELVVAERWAFKVEDVTFEVAYMWEPEFIHNGKPCYDPMNVFSAQVAAVRNVGHTVVEGD